MMTIRGIALSAFIIYQHIAIGFDIQFSKDFTYGKK